MCPKEVCFTALAESYTLWKAIEVCNDLDIRNVILEGDALTIVNVVNGDDEDLSWFGHIIKDIKFYQIGEKIGRWYMLLERVI